MKTMDPGWEHSHKCGWDPCYPQRHGTGCGHVFTHVVPHEEVSTATYDHGHLCPSCKAGPWRGVWMPAVEGAWLALTEDERAQIIADVRKEELIQSFLYVILRRVIR